MCDQRTHGSVGAGAGNRPGYPIAGRPEGGPAQRLPARGAPSRRGSGSVRDLMLLVIVGLGLIGGAVPER